MTKKHLYFALCCAGLLINILSLFEITERFYEKKDVGENFFSLVNPGIFSYIFIAINVGLLITGLMLYIKSSFPKKHSGLLIIVAIAALCAGIIRLLSNDHENPTSVDGPSLLIYIIGFAVLANLKRKKVVTSGFFLLLLMPLSGKAQNFGSAKLDLFGNSQAAYGIRPSGYFFAPLQRSTFMATGETLILFGEEPNLSEALFMCGNLWSIQSAELGFLVGVFLEPTEVSEHESEYEGPVRGGPGAMLVYSNSEDKRFRVHTETGVGYDFHDFVALYDACFWYEINDWSLGARAHYSFGVGATLGYQLPKDFQLNVAGYWDLNNHESKYPLGMTVGIAYRFGDTHH